MEMANQEEPVLHVVVVGFHHKKGCQVGLMIMSKILCIAYTIGSTTHITCLIVDYTVHIQSHEFSFVFTSLPLPFVCLIALELDHF